MASGSYILLLAFWDFLVYTVIWAIVVLIEAERESERLLYSFLRKRQLLNSPYLSWGGDRGYLHFLTLIDSFPPFFIRS